MLNRSLDLIRYFLFKYLFILNISYIVRYYEKPKIFLNTNYFKCIFIITYLMRINVNYLVFILKTRLLKYNRSKQNLKYLAIINRGNKRRETISNIKMSIFPVSVVL